MEEQEPLGLLSLGEWLDTLGVSGSELARRLGVSRQNVQHWKAGREPGATRAIEIARALGLRVEDIAWTKGTD